MRPAFDISALRLSAAWAEIKSASYGDQIRYLRDLERPGDPLFLMQVALVLSVCFAGYLYLGVWEAVLWAFAYTSFQFLEKVSVWMVPEEANFRQYSIVLAVMFIEACIYCAMSVFLWFYGTDVTKFGAVALITAAAMHSTQNRAAFRSILSVFLLPNAAAFCAIAVWSAIGQTEFSTGFIFILIASAITTFFLVAYTQAHLKEAQAKETAEALSQAQKSDTIGKLTADIAHDFNNLISVASSNLQLSLETKDASEARWFTTNAQKAINACSDLTANMLAFGRKAPLRPSPLKMVAVIDDLRQFTDRLVPSNIEITYHLPPEACTVRADPSMLKNALLNLVINAADALEEGGKIRVSVRGLASGAATITVSDDGPGIPAELQSRVFEPFFSTKSELGNSGLGLSMVQGFAAQSNGDVRIETGAGRGTAVTITLPCAKGYAASTVTNKDRAVRPQAARGQHVMLVDDNRQLLEALAIKLSRDGYVVTKFETGDEARQALNAHKVPDILITDAVMPGDTQGKDLIKALRQISPSTPAILLSGYAEPVSYHETLDENADLFLSKPIDLTVLSSSVSNMLVGEEAYATV